MSENMKINLWTLPQETSPNNPLDDSNQLWNMPGELSDTCSYILIKQTYLIVIVLKSAQCQAVLLIEMNSKEN